MKARVGDFLLLLLAAGLFTLLAWMLIQRQRALINHEPSQMPRSFNITGEVIQKLHDLPDTPAFLVNDSIYIDIGCRYKPVILFFLPIWNYEIHYCAYMGNDEEYLIMTRQELDDFAQQGGIELAEHPILPFWTRLGGKLVLGSLLSFLLGYLIWSKLALVMAKHQKEPTSKH